MIVAFYYVERGKDDHRKMAKVAIPAVRRLMKNAKIIHLTDGDTKGLEGVDEVVRFIKGESRADMQSEIEGDVLFLDTDTLLMRDVSDIFNDKSFDAALAIRAETWTDGAQPFNGGVVFSRNQKFWKQIADTVRQTNKHDESALAKVAVSGNFRIRMLPEIYNYSPPGAVAVLHFKGSRQEMLLELSRSL